ncbi:MAG: hypothetical protein KC435_12420 [Thermomicrobiales bacterium]|nr:hypothetical protein [Thermomicrobiales bacterium]
MTTSLDSTVGVGVGGGVFVGVGEGSIVAVAVAVEVGLTSETTAEVVSGPESLPRTWV